MRKERITILALAVTASAAVGAAYLTENFDNQTFPPAGWSIITENHGSESIGWKRYDRGGGNGCAHGYISGEYGSGGITVLATKSLNLKQGSASVAFERYDTSYGGVYYWLEVQLRQGTQIIWHKEFPRAQSWAPFRLNVPVYSSDDYEIGWELEAFFGNPRMGGTVDLYIDNVVIEENTAVEATSLGRVRALYR